MIEWAFYILSALAIASSLAVVLRSNPVICALFLVLTLFCTGGLYLVLNATFLAAMQVLVYAGAIMVLFMFVVMSVPHPERDEVGILRGFGYKLLGFVGIGFLLVKLLVAFRAVELPSVESVPANFGDVYNIGRFFFSKYLFPFEAISFLLLVSIVSAVLISRRAAPYEDPAQEGRL